MPNPSDNSSSSVAHRTALLERDKAIQKKHEAEIFRYKLALDKTNDQNVSLRDSLWDLKNRTKRLVEGLGFSELMEAQAHVDGSNNSAAGPPKYKECLDLVGKLQEELKEVRQLNEKIQSREKELEEENNALRREKEESNFAYRNLSAEHTNLLSRHQDTVKTNELAQERRTKDYEKWTKFKQWILCAADIAEFRQYDKKYGFNGADKSKQLYKIVANKKARLYTLEQFDDSTLFALAEQGPVPSLTSTSVAQKADEATAAALPLGDSSKVNQQPVEENAVPDPDSAFPPRLLSRNTDVSGDRPEGNILGSSQAQNDGDDNDLQFFAPISDSKSKSKHPVFAPPSVPPLPSQSAELTTVASTSKAFEASAVAATVFAPDSETEDDSQSLHWSQFPISTFPPSHPNGLHSKLPSPNSNPSPQATPASQIQRVRPILSPSRQQQQAIFPLPLSRPSSYSPTIPRVLVPNSSQGASGSEPSTPTRAPGRLRHPLETDRTTVGPKLKASDAAVTASSSNLAQFATQHRSSSSRAPPRPRPGSRGPVDFDFDGARDDESPYTDPPNKYRKSDEGRRIPIDRNGSSDRERDSGSVTRGSSRARDKHRRKTDGGGVVSALVYNVAELGRGKENRDIDRRKSDGDRGIRRLVSASNKGKGKEREALRERDRERETPRERQRERDGERGSSTKKKQGPKGPLDEYMVYKGHGRYGKKNKDGDRADKTINELYEIDSTRNGGLDHEFAEVVRGNARKRLAVAEDCEECREYYRTVGPLPPRLQPPLWKSPVKGSTNDDSSPRCRHKRGHDHSSVPSSRKRTHHQAIEDESIFHDLDSPPKSKRDARMGSASRTHGDSASSSMAKSASERAAQAHKQAISRHRADWARGNTPPGYWDIGFPSTQMVDDINQRAIDMHRKKMEEVGREAQGSGGRWRKR